MDTGARSPDRAPVTADREIGQVCDRDTATRRKGMNAEATENDAKMTGRGPDRDREDSRAETKSAPRSEPKRSRSTRVITVRTRSRTRRRAQDGDAGRDGPREHLKRSEACCNSGIARGRRSSPTAAIRMERDTRRRSRRSRRRHVVGPRLPHARDLEWARAADHAEQSRC